MKIIEIERSGIEGDNKLANLYNQFKKLIDELRKKSLPDKVVGLINEDLKVINSAAQNGNDFKKLIKQKQSKIIKLVEKEAKIVPKNYYRNVWLAVGMTAFGLPIGAAIGLAVENIGLLAIGLPIGMGIGIAVGTRMDKKAAQEGRQLDIEIKY